MRHNRSTRTTGHRWHLKCWEGCGAMQGCPGRTHGAFHLQSAPCANFHPGPPGRSLLLPPPSPSSWRARTWPSFAGVREGGRGGCMAQRGIPTAGALPGPARCKRRPAVPAGSRVGTLQCGALDSLPAPIHSAPTALQSYRHPKSPRPIPTSITPRDNTQPPKHRHLIKLAAL